MPPGVRDMYHIGANEVDGDIAIGMCGEVVCESDGLSVEMENVFLIEYLGRKRTVRYRRKGGFPERNANCGFKMLASVYVRKDFGACSMQPFVAVRVVHMPVGIDKVLDGMWS